MKRMIVLICVLVLIAVLCGCTKNNTDIKAPVNFFYANKEIVYNTESSVLSAEVREYAGLEENTIGLFDLYLRGPSSENLYSPFPVGSSVVNTIQSGKNLHIILNDSFATLKGLDLTIACACLSMTAMELTGCDVVEISSENALLDENQSITITRESLQLIDDTQS